MEDVEMELERQLVTVGEKLRTPPSDETELLAVLEEAESLLLKVEQSPSSAMSASLNPVKGALVSREFSAHSNIDVKVSVASCISEITRITAPDAPYDDELMKEIFELIVAAFKGLDDISSPSFPRRISILETVARVRSCVVMLDLECDRLILDMFRNFLESIRENHPDSVFSLMETIMTTVLEESEDVLPELFNCLLDSVKNGTKDIPPIRYKLAEKVIGKCSTKLKPNLLELVQSKGICLADYSGVVASISQEKSSPHENNQNVSEECLEENKLSERTTFEDKPQDRVDRELEPGCSEFVNTATSKSAKVLMSNGTAHQASIDSVDTDKGAVQVPSKVKSSKKKVSHDPSIDKPRLKLSDHDEKSAIPSPNAAADTRSRRRRFPGSKTLSTKAENLKADPSDIPSLPQKSTVKTQQDETILSENIAIEKKAEDTSDSEEKPLKHLGKKGLLKTNQEGKSQARSDLEAKSPKIAGGNKGKYKENESSKKSQTRRGRPQKGRIVTEDMEGEQTLMEMASSPKPKVTTTKGESKSKKTSKTTSTKKHGRGKNISKSPMDAENLDESLIGSRIQVWWPEDEMFYKGVVGSYSPSTKKHKVLYVDGEVEILLLKKEKWEFVNDDEEDMQTLDPTEPPSKKKAKAEPATTSKHDKVEPSVKRNASGDELKGVSGSSGKNARKSVGSKRKQKDRNGDPSDEEKQEEMNDPSKEEADERLDSETTDIVGRTSKSIKMKDGATNSRNDTKNDGQKNGTKTKVGTSNVGSKGSTPKSKNTHGELSNKSKKLDGDSAKGGQKIKSTPKSSQLVANKVEGPNDSDAKSKSSSKKPSTKRRRT